MLSKSVRCVASMKAPAVSAASKVAGAISIPKVVASTTAGAAAVEPKIVPAPMNGTTKQGKITRPISPDLQIWRFSPTAYLHVGVRISGAVLATGMTLTGLYGAVGSCDVPSAIYAMKEAAPYAVPVMKAAVALPLSYHFLGGVRQIYHDFTNKGLDAEFQDKSSYAMAAVSGAVTVVAACI